MDSKFLKGLGKKAEAKSGIMEKVAAGMEKLKKGGSPEKEPSAASSEPPKTPEGKVDHMASITEKVIGKEAASQEQDALASIAKKMGLGEEGTKTAGDEDLPTWQQKVNAAFSEADK